MNKVLTKVAKLIEAAELNAYYPDGNITHFDDFPNLGKVKPERAPGFISEDSSTKNRINYFLNKAYEVYLSFSKIFFKYGVTNRQYKDLLLEIKPIVKAFDKESTKFTDKEIKKAGMENEYRLLEEYISFLKCFKETGPEFNEAKAISNAVFSMINNNNNIAGRGFVEKVKTLRQKYDKLPQSEKPVSFKLYLEKLTDADYKFSQRDLSDKKR